MNKLKLLWFGLIPLGLFLAFKLVEWVQYYLITCGVIAKSPFGLCVFFIMTAFLGSMLLIIGSACLAINLQK